MFGSDHLGIPKDVLALLSSKNTNLSALEVLQECGLIARGVPGFNIDFNLESSSTPSSATCKPLSNLNLNSFEEEDAFLYGEANSVSEGQISITEKTITEDQPVTIRHESGWSDESSNDTCSFNKLNSRLRENFAECEPQNKFEENVELCHMENDEKNHIHTHTPSIKISAENYVSSKLQSDDSVLSLGIEKNSFQEIKSISVGTKSKYHAAAEILKKQTVEKINVINSNSSKKFDVSSELDKSLHSDLKTEKSAVKKTNVINSNSSKKFDVSSELDKSLHSDLKTEKSAVKKPIPRIINRKHIDNRDYITGKKQQKRVNRHTDFSTEQQSSRTSFLPSECHSIYRSLLPSRKFSHSNSEADHIRYASIYSRPRFPSFELEKFSHSRYPENNTQYLSHPKRWPRCFNYSQHRRLRKKITDCSKCKGRSSRSGRSKPKTPGYTSRNKTCDKIKWNQSSRKIYPKKKEYNSADSFCSLSLGSSSQERSDESSDKKKSSSNNRWSCSLDYSHNKRSHEKVSDFCSYKERSPRSQKSKSENPGSYSYRNQTYNTRKLNKSPQKIDHYRKKKEIQNSADSFCSLSLGSSSPGRSDESSDKMKSSTPNRWSHSYDYKHRTRSCEKSSDYNRYKDRNYRSQRSWSRSLTSRRLKSISPRSRRSKSRTPRSISPRSRRSWCRTLRLRRSWSRTPRSQRSRSSRSLEYYS